MKHASNIKVTVQIVTHNNSSTIGDCIQSVLKQRYKNIALVVIDNASTDGTPRILRRLGVQTILLTQNVGYAAAHNKALHRFASKYVLTLNPDIVIDREFVGRLVHALDHAPADVGSAQALLYRVEKLTTRSHVIDSAGIYMNVFRRQNLRFGGTNENTNKLLQEYIFGPDGAAAFYRRAMLMDIDVGSGIFDEDYFMHKEDVDVSWRAQLRGWKSLFVPEAVGYHIRTFRPGERAHVHAELRAHALRNRYYLIVKNDLVLLWLRDVLWISLYDVGIFFYTMLRERESLKAYREALGGLGHLLWKRKSIQTSRRVSTRYMSQWFHWRHI